MRKSTHPTIYDVAKLADTSPSTVSRYMNGRKYVRKDTAERIEKALAELKFEPNRAARTLKTRLTNQVMLAIPDMDNPFYFDLIKAVQAVAKRHNYLLVLAYTEGTQEGEEAILKGMREGHVDGLFMVSFNTDKQALAEVERSYFPLVVTWVANHPKAVKQQNVDFVDVDSRKGTYLAVRQLVSDGHRRIGLVAGVKGIHPFEERYRGYCDALADCDLPLDRQLVFWADYVEQAGVEAAHYFFSLAEPPTAISAANDLLVLGLLSGLEELGRKVPNDVSVIGMDNLSVMGLLKPSISSVYLAQAEIGRMGAEFLFDRIEAWQKGRKIQERVVEFQPRLITRDSVQQQT